MRELVRDSKASSSTADEIQISSFVFPAKRRDQWMQISSFPLFNALFFLNSSYLEIYLQVWWPEYRQPLYGTADRLPETTKKKVISACGRRFLFLLFSNVMHRF